MTLPSGQGTVDQIGEGLECGEGIVAGPPMSHDHMAAEQENYVQLVRIARACIQHDLHSSVLADCRLGHLIEPVNSFQRAGNDIWIEILRRNIGWQERLTSSFTVQASISVLAGK